MVILQCQICADSTDVSGSRSLRNWLGTCPGRGAAPLRRCAAEPGPMAVRARRHGPGISSAPRREARRAAQHPGNVEALLTLRPLVRAHQIGEPLEQIVRVARAGRGLRVILHREYRLALELDAAIGAVEQRDMGLRRPVRQGSLIHSYTVV